MIGPFSLRRALCNASRTQGSYLSIEDVSRWLAGPSCSYLNSIWQQLTQEDCLSFAFLTTRDLLSAAGFSNDERIDYLTGVVDAFFNEFDYVPNLKYQLDLTYRKNRIILTSLKDSQHFYRTYKIDRIVRKSSKNFKGC